MATFKCKMCGGDLNVQEGATVAVCEYCATTQTVSASDDEKRIHLFNRANSLRMNSEFDKAAALYEQIVAEFPGEAEAYWGLCLCNYGVEYVDDPATGKKVPTIHRASFEKMDRDENYRLALEHAAIGARTVYQEQAREIDRIMGEVLAISRDENPYDIFICYKETDFNGARTVDSVWAQDTYDALTARGYKVFFSRITLEDKLGTQYEPYIFAALNSARVMLAFGSCEEYYNAVWVKNEWRRFWKLTAADRTKVLIPCFKDMNPAALPDEFRGLQAQDLGKIGAMQDILRGIDKVFGRTASPTVPSTATPSAASAQAAPLLKRAFMFLEDKSWVEADKYCEKVLDIDPENGMAYLGKLMVEMRAPRPGDLANSSRSFRQNKNYEKAIRFNDEKTAATLRRCCQIVEDSCEKREREKAAERAALENARKEEAEAAERARAEWEAAQPRATPSVSRREAIATGLSQLFDFKGRSRRSEFWNWILVVFLAYIAVFFVFAIVTNFIDASYSVMTTLELILAAVAYLASAAAITRRLHDIGKSGWWQLFALVPYVGWIVLILWCCADGEPQSNDYGASTKYI